MSRKILFFAEAVSLAHVVRPIVLADRLRDDATELHFACADRFSTVRRPDDWTLHDLQSVAPDVFMQRLARGLPVHNATELEAAIRQDLVLLDEVQPDLVIGDFRLSLSMSARLAQVPYVAICNAHWSPWRLPLAAKMPAHSLGGFMGYGFLDVAFQAIWRLISARHLTAPNEIRRHHGLPPMQTLEHWYCDADHVAFVDTPRLVPSSTATPASCHYVGPVIWSPPMPMPDWWSDTLSLSSKLVYLSMGSTGQIELLPALIDACLAEGLRCLVSTAGRTDIPSRPPNVYSQAFLPGLEAAARSALVVCNGGSATVHQALSCGRPVLGICSNLDQVRTMQYVEASGAGRWLRSNEASPSRVRHMIKELLDDERFTAMARIHASDFDQFRRAATFETMIDGIINNRRL